MTAQITALLAKQLGEETTKRQPVHLVGVLAPGEMARHIRAVASRPASEHVSTRRLAFASREALVYPDSEPSVAEHQGKTVVLQHLELSGEPFATIAADITELTGRTSAVSCYMSTPTNDAFGWHVDEWDSVAWQIVGSKVFEFPHDFKARLSPGDLLYIPRGLEHRTMTLETSIHLSCLAVERIDGK